MVRSTVFRNNTTQAVPLPRAVALPDGVTIVEVHVVGDARVITPVGGDWAHWFATAPAVSDDFLVDRDQPAAQDRDGG